MTLKERIEFQIQQIQCSPLLHEESGQEVRQLQQDLYTLYEKVNQPLRVAVIGEVKSGKSTLINAFAQGQVSPTNVTEATACILKLVYAPEEKGTIYFTDGTSFVGSISSIFEQLRTHENDQTFFNTCDYVLIQMPLPGLRNIELIDTPGLATITNTNAERTQHYFQAVDVILWVLNGNYLGQSDVNEELRKVAQMGKKIIAVINRIDQIQGDPQELIDYVDDALGIYLQAIFPLSAKTAFEGVMTQNDHLKKISGFTDLYEYLNQNIERQSSAVQEEVMKASLLSLENKIKFIHLQALKNIKNKIELYQQLDEKLIYSGKLMQNKIISKTKSWIHSTYLSELEHELNTQIENLGILKTDATGINATLEKGLDKNKLQAEVNKFMKEISIDAAEEWKNQLTTIDEELSALFHEQEISVQNQLSYLLTSQDNASSMSNSLMIAGTTGGILSIYTAVLAPGAAYVSLQAALASFMPPLLLAGAAVGFITGYTKSKKMKAQYRSYIMKIIDSARKQTEEQIIPELNACLIRICEETRMQSREKFVNANFNGYTTEKLQNLTESLQQYCRRFEDETSSSRLLLQR